MPFDLAPALWLPPKPAIIRPARDLVRPAMLPGLIPGPGLIAGGAQLAVVNQNVSNSGGSTTTTPTITLPSGVANNTLVIVAIQSASNVTWSWPGDWTSFFGTDARISGAYKVSSGSDTTVIPTQSSTATSSWASFVISGQAASGFIAAGAVASGSSVSADPPSLTSGFGAVNTLWIAVAGSFAAGAAVTAGPGGSYTNFQNSAATSGSALGTAYRFASVATEDPGAFTVTSGNWRAETIAVKGG